ncbi:MAG: class II fructose-bisphosphate aldolase [Pseudolysinimonas sp.]
MTLVTTACLVDDAVRSGRAVVAFNVITLEHAEAIAAGASRANRGVILQVSENAVRFHGGDLRPLLAACREVAIACPVGMSLHLDHVESEELADVAISGATDLGLSSIMLDASVYPYEENVALTERLGRRARLADLWVEAELGAVGGKDGAHAPGVRTDPAEAAAFVAATHVDGLAVAVGSSHAMSDRSASLDVDLIGRLAQAVPIPLVLHGSSGVPDADLLEAVAAGIRKVNIGTALNVAGTAAFRSAFAAHPDVVDPRPATAAARDAMADVVAHFATLVG